ALRSAQTDARPARGRRRGGHLPLAERRLAQGDNARAAGAAARRDALVLGEPLSRAFIALRAAAPRPCTADNRAACPPGGVAAHRSVEPSRRSSEVRSGDP